jgi:hypothetical protein
MDSKKQPTYPLLEALLYAKGLKLQGTYTNADVASLFGVSVRTIQSHAADGSLPSRKLIGRATEHKSDCSNGSTIHEKYEAKG